MSNEFEIEGFDELKRLIVAVGAVPQKVATKVSRQGANLILQNIKAKAPYDTGLLKQALKLVGEKSKFKGKKVYEITYDKQLSGDGENGLVKISKHTNKRAYYPASQEFGWTNMYGTHVPGLHFMKNATEESFRNAQQKIVDSAKTELDKIIAQYSNDMRR